MARSPSRSRMTGGFIASGLAFAAVLSVPHLAEAQRVPAAQVTSHGSLSGLASDDHPQYLRTDGARALAGDLSAGGHRIRALGAAQGPGDAVRFEQAVKTGDGAGGDLAGAFPSPLVAGLRGRPVADAAPQAGQVLTWTGSAWAPAACACEARDREPELQRLTREIDALRRVNATFETTLESLTERIRRLEGGPRTP